MLPPDFLREEILNVEQALVETLRYDYGPEKSRDYFDECKARLARIKASSSGVTDSRVIAGLLSELNELTSWISFIERSHLGEFSWPFADELRRTAEVLFAERNLKGTLLTPIVHIVSEGDG